MRKLLALFLCLQGCRLAGAEPAPRSERIVSLSKQYSEIICALGAQANLVGVDLSSTFPPELKTVPKVGYHRALSVEALLAVKPSLILHDGNVGPEHVLRQLEDLKVPMKVFDSKGEDIPATKRLIAEMGRYFHQEGRAEELNRKLDSDLARATAAPAARRPLVMVIHYGQAMNVYLAMTTASVAGKMIDWAGGQLAVKGERGMVQLSPEVVAQADPEVILLTDFGYDRLGSPGQIAASLPGVAATRAARAGRIYRVEEHDLVYLGPRTGQNVLLLKELLGRAAAR